MLVMFVLALATVPVGTTSVSKEKDPNQKVCRTEYPLGSRIPERVCKTRGEWDAIAKQTREELRRAGTNRSESRQD